MTSRRVGERLLVLTAAEKPSGEWLVAHWARDLHSAESRPRWVDADTYLTGRDWHVATPDGGYLAAYASYDQAYSLAYRLHEGRFEWPRLPQDLVQSIGLYRRGASHGPVAMALLGDQAVLSGLHRHWIQAEASASYELAFRLHRAFVLLRKEFARPQPSPSVVEAVLADLEGDPARA
ncbi:hypothetical protein [Streptomyces sp. NPDC007172]|uniref:hypothetical protein n=1 Tax=Streptomyces sp. NPDC007172 TaxID=3364776 RepID=UPI00368E4EA4